MRDRVRSSKPASKQPASPEPAPDRAAAPVEPPPAAEAGRPRKGAPGEPRGAPAPQPAAVPQPKAGTSGAKAPSAAEQPAHPGISLSPPNVVPESDVRTHSPSAAAPPKDHGQVEGLGELPWMYGDGRLVSLIRDPQTLYVYWDLSEGHLQQSFGGLGTARAALRLWIGTRLYREVEIHTEARGWYLRDLPPNTEFRVELWALGEKGERLIRSARPVRLPAAQPSDSFDELYAVLPHDLSLARLSSLVGGRPVAWKSGAAPPGWERRGQVRLSPGNRSSSGLPWGSGTPHWSDSGAGLLTSSRGAPLDQGPRDPGAEGEPEDER